MPYLQLGSQKDTFSNTLPMIIYQQAFCSAIEEITKHEHQSERNRQSPTRNLLFLSFPPAASLFRPHYASPTRGRGWAFFVSPNDALPTRRCRVRLSGEELSGKKQPSSTRTPATYQRPFMRGKKKQWSSQARIPRLEPNAEKERRGGGISRT